MPMLRILTFNWHDPYLSMFSRVGHQIEVGDWMLRADGTRGWDVRKRPLPDGLTLIGDPQAAVASLKRGIYDLAVCHTPQDLSFVAPFDVPTVYLSHNALHNDGMNDPARMEAMRREIGGILARRNGVFAAISPMKLESWGLDGFVVRPGIDLEDYSGYTGEERVALCVGNLFVERDHMLGYRYLREIVAGLPHRIVGENPKLPEAQKAESWEALKDAYRRCRVYVNTTVEAFEDGYNLGMLEAMATGMPVVCLANRTSPVRDGENGYISGDVARLRERVEALLEDRDLAEKLGSEARRTVADEFSMGAFVARWHEIFHACLSRKRGVVVPKTGGPGVITRIDRADIFPYTRADVAAFLDVKDRSDIVVPRLKLDRMGENFLCDLFLYHRADGRPMVWQGLEVYPGAGAAPEVVWPPYLEGVGAEDRQLLNRAIARAVAEVQAGTVPKAQSIHVNLGGADAFPFRVGEDRVSPGDARSDIFLHHAKRYAFARQFCRGKRVLDIGSGAGYGSKMLARDAARVVGVDISCEAQRYAAGAFEDPSIRRLVSDMRALGVRDGQFDAAVCFEAVEHIREHGALLNEVRRLLGPGGVFVVSTPNKAVYGRTENANPYHVGMLAPGEFQALLERHFESVQMYGQMRLRQGEGYYGAFDFRDGVNIDEDEVFVAVCRGPRARVVSGAGAGGVPAVRVKPSGDGKGRPLRVLFCHVSNPISVGRYYVDAFRRAHEVITCGPVIDAGELAAWREAEAEHALKPAGAGEVEKMDLIARLARPCDIPMPRGEVDIGRALSQLPGGWRPDLFVWADSAAGFLPVGIEKLDCPTVCLVGDTHTGQMDWRIAYARAFQDVFLMFNRQHIPHFEAAGCKRVWWLPGACDPAVHGGIPAGKSYDIGFVGQTHRRWHAHRVRLLERLIQAGFDVRIESKILQEMALFYSRCRMVFNRSLNHDLNMRVFEALCSGSLLLTDRLPRESGLEDLFQDREHFVVYDEENLEDVARDYLEHEAEREAIAARGREAVLAGHTYAHRVDRIVTAVFEAEAEGIARCVVQEGTPVARKRAEEPAAYPGEAEMARRFLQNWKGPVRLNLGCGEDRREGYINVDKYVPSADLQMDIFQLAFEDGTVDEIFSSHMLEHLGKYEVPKALAEWRRVLRPGAMLRMNLPDLEWAAQQWLNGPEAHRWGFALDTIFGLQTHAGEYHKTGFTAPRIERLLTEAGFARISVSRIWSHEQRCLWVEAVRPQAAGELAGAGGGGAAPCRRPEATGAPAMAPPPRVSVVILLYNEAARTEACLKGLEEAGAETPYELVLVDNGSTDGTGELLDRMANRARIVRSRENLGFARGNNTGAADARGDYLLFLNNDTVPHRGWLDALVAEADADAQVGVVGAKLLYPDTGQVQHAGIELINGVPDHVHRHAAADAPEVNRARDLDMVTGACLLIRRDLFERLGGFDEGYVNGVEDVDLCLRARDLGYRVRYCPGAVLDHCEGASAGRYDHVRPNLERFVQRWNGRFDAAGRFVPARRNGTAAERHGREGVLRGCWEGTQFVYHSLSLVNMALTSELIRSGACELKIIPYEPAAFGPDVDPERYGPIAERMEAGLSGPAQFHVKHKWPPDFTPPPSGHWVMIQPWEFGRIPASWVRPIREMVDEVWAPSRYARQCYVDSGIDPDEVHVVPNGVQAERFRPDAPPLELATQKSFKFLFVGGAIYRKGIDVLLETYRKAFSRKDDICLVIKGMGDETFYRGQTAAGEIRKMQADPEAPEVLYLTDDLTGGQMAGLYTACDCLVHPYRGEGFGMPVVEAMACGMPVIVTRGGACDDFCAEDRAYFVPSTRRAVKMHDETAGETWLLEPDAEALAAQMRAVVANPDRAREKGRRAREYVLEHLTWAHAAARALERLHALQKKPIKRESRAGGRTPEGESGPGDGRAGVDAAGARERQGMAALEAGDRYRAGGDTEKAIACYREALEARPDDLEALLVLSVSLLEENRPGEAAELLRKLAERHPESSRVQNYLGRCLFQNGETEAARACFETSIELDPGFPEAHSNLGVLLWETGELDRALEALNRAAELAPNNPDVIYNIGMVYAQLGQARQASQMLRHYLRARPDDLNARVYLAVLFLENGAEDDGLTELERVLAENPEHPEALKVVAQLQDAVSGAGQEEGEDA